MPAKFLNLLNRKLGRSPETCTQSRRILPFLTCGGNVDTSSRSTTIEMDAKLSSLSLIDPETVVETNYRGRPINENFMEKADTRQTSPHATGAKFDGTLLAPKTKIA